jgi:isopenicillin-N N-acyltransferase like protein
MFACVCKLAWPDVLSTALKFLPYLSARWPAYVEEVRGVAEGAGAGFEDILAINVRTEIAYGMFDDGCTAFAWRDKDGGWLAQNWDVSALLFYEA